MSFKAILGDIIPKYMRLNKTEAKILDTLITMKSGNAYGLWKVSGLKHYPTVLRALKKLEEKRFVQVLSESGARGERIYTPTLVGTLISYIFDGDEKQIINMVAKNSSLFRELSQIDKDENRTFFAIQEIILDMYRKTKPRGIDEAVKSRVEEEVEDHVINILNEGALEWLLKVSKVVWVRQLVIRRIREEIIRSKTNLEQLETLKETLTKKYLHPT